MHSFDFSGLYSTYDWQQQIDCNSNKGIKFQACLKLRSDFDNGELTFFLPLPLDFFPFFSCSLSCPSSLKLYRAQISAISVHHHHRNPIKAFFFFFFPYSFIFFPITLLLLPPFSSIYPIKPLPLSPLFMIRRFL